VDRYTSFGFIIFMGVLVALAFAAPSLAESLLKAQSVVAESYR